jgi:hypothetical protein
MCHKINLGEEHQVKSGLCLSLISCTDKILSVCLLHILRRRGARLRPWKRGRVGRAAGGGEQEGEAEVSYTRGEVSVEEDDG